MRDISNRPLYSIGVVAELLDVHPETIRTWERSGIVRPPQRRSGKRTFSANDLKRLQFVHRLATEGLSIRAIHYYLRLYPCWQTDGCTQCIHSSDQEHYTKPCWREASMFCKLPSNESLCAGCENNPAPEQTEATPSRSDPQLQNQKTLSV